jgi:WD40 repeat protein
MFRLRKEMNWINNWIKRIEVDTVNCHLYCCTRTDLYIYDFNGSLIRIYKDCHRLSITTCVYSPNAKVVLTGSEDAEIKVWSLAGGQIEIFRGHTSSVTNLVLNPYNSNLVISSSLDGTIKMWSLDVMQMIYELNYFDEHIIWMGLTEDKLLFAATPSKITMWSMNNFIDFWALSRYIVSLIEIFLM